MNTTLITVGAVAVFALALNILLIWYTKQLLGRLNSSVEDQKEISVMFGSFTEHLSSIYELEMYYGDETLSNLLRHSKAITEELELYDKEYTLEEESDEETAEHEDQHTQNQEPQED